MIPAGELSGLYYYSPNLFRVAFANHDSDSHAQGFDPSSDQSIKPVGSVGDLGASKVLVKILRKCFSKNGGHRFNLRPNRDKKLLDCRHPLKIGEK